jgi:hypothetical protein
MPSSGPTAINAVAPKSVEARIPAAAEELRRLHESGEICWTDLSPLAAYQMAFLDDDPDDRMGFSQNGNHEPSCTALDTADRNRGWGNCVEVLRLRRGACPLGFDRGLNRAGPASASPLRRSGAARLS